MPSHVHEIGKIHRIACIPGDGIGVDITDAAIKVLDVLAKTLGGFEFEFKSVVPPETQSSNNHLTDPAPLTGVRKNTSSAAGTCRPTVSSSSRSSMRFTLALWDGLVHIHHPFHMLSVKIWLTSMHRCSRPYQSLGPDSPYSKSSKPIRQCATNAGSARDQESAGRLPDGRSGLDDYPRE
jgi:hypothetical protein